MNPDRAAMFLILTMTPMLDFNVIIIYGDYYADIKQTSW